MSPASVEVGTRVVTEAETATVETAVNPIANAMHAFVVLIVENELPQSPPIGRLALLPPEHPHSFRYATRRS